MSGLKRRVLFVVSREPSYVRNDLILRALTELGWYPWTCASTHTSYLRRLVSVFVQVFRARLEASPRFIVAGFLGQPLVGLLRILFPRTPIIFDAFISVHDTLCYDRRRFKPHSIIGKLAFFLDSHACSLADSVVVDTPASAEYFGSVFGVSKNKMFVLPVGADERIFFDRKATPRFDVFYYSTTLPIHGLDVVLEAARQMEPEGTTFRIVGPRLPGEALRGNVERVDWQTGETLAIDAAAARICLGGHFGLSNKARRVVAGKTYQFLSCRRPVVVTFGAGNGWLLRPGVDAFFCVAGSADALVEAIRGALSDEDRAARIAEEGFQTYSRKASHRQLVEILSRIIQATLQSRRNAAE